MGKFLYIFIILLIFKLELGMVLVNCFLFLASASILCNTTRRINIFTLVSFPHFKFCLMSLFFSLGLSFQCVSVQYDMQFLFNFKFPLYYQSLAILVAGATL